MINEINNKPYDFLSYLKRVRKYRFLLVSLSKRELKVKYSRTILGLGWVFVQPLVAVIVYTMFFRNFIKLDTNQIPYVQFVFSGVVFWYIFTGILAKGSNSLLESTELINKVSFPRIILVVAKSFPVIIEGFVLYLVLLGIVIFNNDVSFSGVVLSLFYLLQIIIFSSSLAVILSVMVVWARDILHVIPFAIGFGIWLTPVFYPVSIIPAQYQNYVRYLNPVANAIEGLRDTLFMGKPIGLDSLIIFFGSLVLLLIALIFFIKFERKIVGRI